MERDGVKVKVKVEESGVGEPSIPVPRAHYTAVIENLKG